MALSFRSPSVASLVRSALGSSQSGPADSVLLAQFVESRDDGAFELLVWRHAAMVLRVCQGVLHDHHAAEDVTQATFMALARQAKSVNRQGSVAGWLYRVARRSASRLARQRFSTVLPASDLELFPDARSTTLDPETTRLVHDELAKLPDQYRVPLLLCFFEGLTHTDAAMLLGWPLGTLATRVARGKVRLARRLSARGIAVPVAGLAALLTADSVMAVSPSFVAITSHAAMAFAAGAAEVGVSHSIVELAQGAIRTMTLQKLKWTAALLALCGAFTVSAGLAIGQRPGDGTRKPNPEQRVDEKATAAEERQAGSSQRRRSMDNLKQIMLAIHNYTDTYQYFPADIRDKDGKALLSWRVSLLPFMNQDALYRQFRLNEPWDSEHNLKLLPQMPAVLRVGFEPKSSGHTYYQAFAGPNTPLHPMSYGADGGGGPLGAGSAAPAEGGSAGGSTAPAASTLPGLGGAAGPLVNPTPKKPAPAAGSAETDPMNDKVGGRPRINFSNITDGTSNTLAVVEAGPPVPWTKPADLPFDPKQPLPKLVGPFFNTLHVAMCDGSVYALRRNIDETLMRNLIQINDGSVIADLSLLRSPMPAETEAEKQELRKMIAENQRVLGEIDKLLKEHIDLMAEKNAKSGDLLQTEEQSRRLKEIEKELRERNETLRKEIRRDR